jgi:type IV pilus assembly protein PilP
VPTRHLPILVLLIAMGAAPVAAQPPAAPPPQPVEKPAAPAPAGQPAAPAAAPVAPAQPGQAVTPPAAAPAAAPYAYDPQGRRDPFVSLVARGSDPVAPGSRPPGVEGLLVAEITVKGVVHDRTGFIAMIQGPDSKTYIVRAGEKLMDGSIKSISADTLVLLQDVTDPLSPVKQREVRKAVRATDGGRS